MVSVFDPTLMHEIDIRNFHGIDAPRAPSFRRRNGCPVKWAELRTEAFATLKLLNSPEHLRRLYERMDVEIRGGCGVESDLVRVCADVIARSLIPLIVEGLSPEERQIVLAEQELRLDSLLRGDPSKVTRAMKVKTALAEFRLGQMLRRVLAERVQGRRPQQSDLAQAMAKFAERLGRAGSAYFLTTILTAICGAPGPMAACALGEYQRRAKWREQINNELSGLTIDVVTERPTLRAPITLMFLKEVLRLWSFPAMVRRGVKKDIEFDDVRLKEGDVYILSSFVAHRNPNIWEDPDKFAPERWRETTKENMIAYIPFGWGERSCIGAQIGTSQLILFLHLIVNKYAITLGPTSSADVEYKGGVATPRKMVGIVKEK